MEKETESSWTEKIYWLVLEVATNFMRGAVSVKDKPCNISYID